LPRCCQRSISARSIGRGARRIQDFELNIRNVSGGQGLIAFPDASLPGGRGAVDPCVFNLRFAANETAT